jgi:hypothetical protein
MANDGKNEQHDRDDKQPGRFGGVNRMPVVMLVVRRGLRRSGGIHAGIVAFSGVDGSRLPVNGR